MTMSDTAKEKKKATTIRFGFFPYIIIMSPTFVMKQTKERNCLGRRRFTCGGGGGVCDLFPCFLFYVFWLNSISKKSTPTFIYIYIWIMCVQLQTTPIK